MGSDLAINTSRKAKIKHTISRKTLRDGTKLHNPVEGFPQAQSSRKKKHTKCYKNPRSKLTT